MFIVGTFVLSLGLLGSGLQGLHVSICINLCLYIFVNKMRYIYIYIYVLFILCFNGLLRDEVLVQGSAEFVIFCSKLKIMVESVLYGDV